MKRILVCLDFTDISDSVVKSAIDFANKLDAELKLVYVSSVHNERVSHVVSSDNKQQLSVALMKEHNRMSTYKSQCRQEGVECKAVILSGALSEVLPKEAREYDPAFIIIGSRTTSAANHMIKGSVGADLLKKVKKPVLLVPLS